MSHVSYSSPGDVASFRSLTNNTPVVGCGAVVHPRPMDVVFGRGRRCQDHPGNIHFQKLVQSRRLQYRQAKRKEKMLLVQQVIQGVVTGSATTAGGRFLRHVGSSWYEESFTSDAVVQKVAHCLRERLHSKIMQPKETAKQGVIPNEKVSRQLKPPATVLSLSVSLSSTASPLRHISEMEGFFLSDDAPSTEEQTTNDYCPETLPLSVIIDDCSSRSSSSSGSNSTISHAADNDDAATFDALYRMVFENQTRPCHLAHTHVFLTNTH
jgi:hypothetical protein